MFQRDALNICFKEMFQRDAVQNSVTFTQYWYTLFRTRQFENSRVKKTKNTGRERRSF